MGEWDVVNKADARSEWDVKPVPSKKSEWDIASPSVPAASTKKAGWEAWTDTSGIVGIAEGVANVASLTGAQLVGVYSKASSIADSLVRNGKVNMQHAKELGDFVTEFYSYQPKTKTGKEVAETIANPFQKAGEGLAWIFRKAGDTPDQAAQKTALVFDALIVAGGIKGASAKKPGVGAVDPKALDVLQGRSEEGHVARPWEKAEGRGGAVHPDWFEGMEPSEAAQFHGEWLDISDQKRQAARELWVSKMQREDKSPPRKTANDGLYLANDRTMKSWGALTPEEQKDYTPPPGKEVPRGTLPEVPKEQQKHTPPPAARSWLKKLGDKFSVNEAPNARAAGLINEFNDHGYAREYPNYWAQNKLSEVFDGDPKLYNDKEITSNFWGTLNKNRILGGHDRFTRRAKAAQESGDHVTAAQWKAKAAEIEKNHDLQEYDAEVRSATGEASFQRWLKNYQEKVEPELAQLYNENRGVDPHHELDTDGRYFKAHVNLVHAGEEGSWSHTKPDPPSILERFRDKMFGKPEDPGAVTTTRTGRSVKVNDTVKAPDRGNYGKVLSINKIGVAKVEFTNPDTGATMVVDFPAHDLEATNGPGSAAGGQRGGEIPYRRPDIKQDAYDQRATFSGTYSTDMGGVLEHVFGSRWNEVTKSRLYKAILEKGAGIEYEEGQRRPSSINGREVHASPFEFSMPSVDASGNKVLETKRMWVTEELYPELTAVVDTADRVPKNPVGSVLTAIQIATVGADATAHIKNELTVLAKATGRESAVSETIAKIPFVGQISAAYDLVKISREVLADGPEIRAELERIGRVGTLRARYGTGKGNLGHRLITAADQAGRILMNRFFDEEVKRGNFTNTLENRRDFINQMGMYNRRLMGPWMRAARDSGFSSFIVAGRNYNANLAKMLSGSPGAETTGLAANLEVRGKIVSGIVAATTIPFLINQYTTGSPTGRPGTPFGTIDPGFKKNEDGSHDVLDAYGITGIRRGLRVTGAGAIIEGIHQGHDANQIAGKVAKDTFSSQLHPWAGPPGRFLYESTTGENLGTGKQQAYKIPEGGVKQQGENVRASIEALNPVAYAALNRPGSPKQDDKSSYSGELIDSLIKTPLAALGKSKAFDPMSGPEKKAYAYYRSKFGDGITAQQEVKFKFNATVKELLKNDPELGVEKLDTLYEEGRITRHQAKRLEQTAERARIVTWVQGIEFDQALDIYKDVKKSGDKQLQLLLADEVEKKYRNSRRTMPEQDREKYYEIVQSILDEADSLEGYR